MYTVMVFLSIFIRQYCLPNPFIPLGDMAILANYLASGILVPVSFAMTGLVYEKGSFPAFGSFLFLGIYILNTIVLEFIFTFYPVCWLMGGLGITYLVLFVFVGMKLREGFN